MGSTSDEACSRPRAPTVEGEQPRMRTLPHARRTGASDVRGRSRHAEAVAVGPAWARRPRRRAREEEVSAADLPRNYQQDLYRKKELAILILNFILWEKIYGLDLPAECHLILLMPSIHGTRIKISMITRTIRVHKYADIINRLFGLLLIRLAVLLFSVVDLIDIEILNISFAIMVRLTPTLQDLTKQDSPVVHAQKETLVKTISVEIQVVRKYTSSAIHDGILHGNTSLYVMTPVLYLQF
ncbi:uncharacterized protein LOC128422553 isoform X2 [Podarcis raffonei]|uniref:uncharacterized protein LOC128422553 isoform X2 n=1 Tax=Podarcis raffonei TaxID=65483 RepID=UPI0023298349|nr:uncharacterized protein LOC128422553 isoform X2 [Podarcis raffonei]